ncbi:hypothetical protein M918_13245 [Clostridium sp. BL8]|nr:hypothetical protein M918_13245 [Clostridium sp. BL8]
MKLEIFYYTIQPGSITTKKEELWGIPMMTPTGWDLMCL